MENILNVRKANDFKVGQTYVESNYYHLTCTGKGETFTADYGTTYQEVKFNVTTKTGRTLEPEIRKFAA